MASRGSQEMIPRWDFQAFQESQVCQGLMDSEVEMGCLGFLVLKDGGVKMVLACRDLKVSQVPVVVVDCLDWLVCQA